MDKIGHFNFTIPSQLCDFAGQASLAYLFDLFLESAGRHADERGFGYKDISRQGKAWVISRVGIYMQRYPQNEEQIGIQTWVHSIEKFFTHRRFLLLDASGKEIGCAQSIWAAIDLATRRPTDIAEMDSSILDYLGVEKELQIGKIGKIPSVDTPALFEYAPKYSDIDINRHFNSVKYVGHILNLFDIQRFGKQDISSFEIAYLSEALSSSKLSFHRKEYATDSFVTDLKNIESNQSVCRASLSFSDK